MCGIIAVARRRSTRTLPSAEDILSPLAAASSLLAADLSDTALEQLLDDAAKLLGDVTARLSGVPGLYRLLA